MNDRERRKRRQQIERRMQARRNGGREEKTSSNFFFFRIYLTVVLAGSVLALSFLQTETTLKVCETVKNTIAYHVDGEELSTAGERIFTYLQGKDIALPSFGVKNEAKDEKDKTQEQNKTQEQDKTQGQGKTQEDEQEQQSAEDEIVKKEILYKPEIPSSP